MKIGARSGALRTPRAHVDAMWINTAARVLPALDRAALAPHAGPDDWVMVHDAVRPCVRRQDIDELIAVATSNNDGGLLAIPVSDTVKRSDASQRALETVSRNNLWRALTPQLFKLKQLEDALKRALANGLDVTDEACAVETTGGRPVLVPGHADNIKVTTPEDLPLAEFYLRQQGVT